MRKSSFLDEKKKIILGIDPGTVIMGYGLITVQSKAMSLLEMGVLHLSKFEDHAETPIRNTAGPSHSTRPCAFGPRCFRKFVMCIHRVPSLQDRGRFL